MTLLAWGLRQAWAAFQGIPSVSARIANLELRAAQALSILRGRH